jgi:hypothetical protein
MDPEPIRLALGTLRGYVGDLVDSAPSHDASITTRFAQFTTKLRLLMNYCERDEVIRWVTQELHHRGENPVAWFHQRADGEAPARPTSPRSHALAHTYRTLLAIKKNQLELRAFVSSIYADKGGYQNAFRAFREEYVLKLRDGLLGLAASLEERLAEDAVDMDTLVSEAYAAFDDTGGAEEAAGAAATDAAPEEKIDDSGGAAATNQL